MKRGKYGQDNAGIVGVSEVKISNFFFFSLAYFRFHGIQFVYLKVENVLVSISLSILP